jgi:hypothetical protein
LSEADPDVAAEGSLDPLGLGQLADVLADTIAPGVTARMTRPRLLTAMAVSAVLAQQHADRMAADGITPAWLVVEWHVIEALVSAKGLPETARRGVPGTAKTRSVLAHNGHVDAKSYLKTAKVFGFHGVFKRLAVSLGMLDDSLALTERGDHLARTWEREQDLPGLVDALPRTTGGQLRRTFENAVTRAIDRGVAQAVLKPSAQCLAESLRADDGGPEERSLLWGWLIDPAVPVRREVLLGLDRRNFEGWAEADVLATLRDRAGEELAVRLDAIAAYEQLSCTLTRAFDACRVLGRQYGVGGATMAQAAGLDEVHDAASNLAREYDEAVNCLERLQLASRLEATLGGLASSPGPDRLVDDLFAHHERVQANKAPTGKRPWFERTPRGFVVRPSYGLDEVSAAGSFVHPMRVTAMRTFCHDLRQ